MARVLLISGSPRKGNTDFILSLMYENTIGSKELILLREKSIQHCKGCLACHRSPECIIKDDMEELRKKMLGSDVMIIGTPNYFDNVTGLLKDFVDRTHPFYRSGLLKDKKLVLIMVGGGKIEGSKQYLDCTMEGFVKYLKLDLLGSYCFQALNKDDLKESPEMIARIDQILDLYQAEINHL